MGVELVRQAVCSVLQAATLMQVGLALTHCLSITMWCCV